MKGATVLPGALLERCCSAPGGSTSIALNWCDQFSEAVVQPELGTDVFGGVLGLNSNWQQKPLNVDAIGFRTNLSITLIP